MCGVQFVVVDTMCRVGFGDAISDACGDAVQ